MENAKEEFLTTCEGLPKVIAAHIQINRGYDKFGESDDNTYILKKGYTEEDFQNFLTSIDKEYDAGYGGQELYGTIWFAKNVWAERGEYDGSEWWEVRQYPKIPKEVK